MLQFQEFDLKTGKYLTDFNPDGDRTPRVKQVENCYLEKWFQTHRIEPQNLHVANFYNGVNDSDRLRLEAKGKYLICTSGKSGYFTDWLTAELIAKGDISRDIRPIYADGKRSAHNAVAYGSLVVSDGKSATQTKSGNSRILIIDDEQRSSGATPLIDREGRKIPTRELAHLYDKMGDGTMLASTNLLRGLLLDKEVLLAIDRGLQQSEDVVDDELGDLGEWIDTAFGESYDPDLAGKLLEEYQHTGRISNYSVDLQTAQTIEKKIDRIARSAVLQFRAATPDLPGIAKGTVATSSWCERLGVDAIVSTNDIKGDDGRLKEPGIIELNSFLWVNRKIKAEYSNQSVGAQVKGTIPEATLNELNPMMAAKAAELADVAIDNWQVAAKFVAKEEARRERELIIDTPEGIDGTEEEPRNNRATLATLLKADKYGQLNQLPNISRQLNKSLRRDRLNVATSGIVVPAAMAQHHSKLEPWEVCNRDLPHGAIVAYYRSPFPNVGAAAIAINNLEVLHDRDREAFAKRGVVYMNPWTAKHVAITDFDSDRNGFFVGYLANDNLPSQLRERLSHLPLTGGERYEAGREVLAQIILEPDLEQGKFPLAVKEFIEANAPDCKPLPIAKAKKADHPWHEGEPLTQAIWRAWDITANNPTGKVANQSIILQSLASETVYIEPKRKPALLKQIGVAFSEISPEEVPSDEYLVEHGLPPMQLADKIEKIVQASKQIDKLPAAERLAFAQVNLITVNQLLKNCCDSGVAKNLQTAVDTAKSSIGIDETIHAFGERIQYKQHQLRQNVKKPDIYLTRDLPTNTQEPIGWAVETANRFYNGGQQQSQLQEIESEDLNKHFRSLIPITHNDAQKGVVDEFARRYSNCTKAIGQVENRLNRELPEDQQPTLTIVSSSGKSLVVQRLCDADVEGDSPVWNLSEGRSDTKFEIYRNLEGNGKENYAVYLVDAAADKISIGYVSPESATANNLNQFNIGGIDGKKCLSVSNSTIEFHPPFVLENDVDAVFASADKVLSELESSIPNDKRMQYASAAWHSSVGMGMATKVFVDEISQHLDRVPPIALNCPTAAALELRNGADLTIRFERDLHISAIAPDGSTQDLGLTTYGDSPLLSPGTVVIATIERPPDPKLRIQTDLGEFVINPAPTIGKVQIEGFAGKFAFDRRGKDIAVNYLGSGGRRIPIGVLGRELINKESIANLQSGSNLLKGTLSRGLNEKILEIRVQSLIDHQPVATIDRNELVPLPQPSISQDSANPAARSVGSDDRNENRRYFPTAGELRQLYSGSELAGDIAKMAEIKSWGTLLNDAYPDSDRAPDEFFHWVVEIPVSDDLYHPNAKELRTAYATKFRSGETKDLDRIKELGNALNQAYPDDNRAPDDFTSLKVAISMSEKQALEIDSSPLKSPQLTNERKVADSLSEGVTVILPTNKTTSQISIDRARDEEVDMSL